MDFGLKSSKSDRLLDTSDTQVTVKIRSIVDMFFPLFIDHHCHIATCLMLFSNGRKFTAFRSLGWITSHLCIYNGSYNMLFRNIGVDSYHPLQKGIAQPL